MLAAASSRSDRTLESVWLVLQLEKTQQQYPEQLRNHFREIIDQTLALLVEPDKNVAEAMPEAVSLAVKMLSDNELKEAIESLAGKSEFSKEQAEQALSSLEASFDTNRQSPHLSQEVLGAI